MTKVDNKNFESLVKRAKEDPRSVIYCHVSTPAQYELLLDAILWADPEELHPLHAGFFDQDIHKWAVRYNENLLPHWDCQVKKVCG